MKRVSESLGRRWRGGWRGMIEIEALTQKKTLAEGERQERDSKIDRLRGRDRGRPIEDRETESGERE